MRNALTSTVVAWAMATIACGAVHAVAVPPTAPPPEELAQLWVDPGDTPRDLFWGVGGEEYAPSPDTIFKATGRDDRGFSVSYDVVDPDGTAWSAKTGPEAQTEVVLSRVLWGLGYHQPPIYHLAPVKIDVGQKALWVEPAARMRPKLKTLKHLDDPWRWADNAFLGARELRGLLVILLMFNSTDLKDENNAVYEVKDSWEAPSRWFLVRDLGAALGETGRLFPRRNSWPDFEKIAFITGVQNDRVTFDYRGLHQELLTMIQPDDVRWAADRLSRLTDQQWHDAFRAASYPPAEQERYIGRLKEKIEDGVALRVDRRVHGHH